MQRSSAALLALLLVGACTPAQQLGPTGTTGPTVPAATAVATPVVATLAASPAASTLAATELPRSSSADLVPGRYTKPGFVPRITFEVGDGWRAVQAQQGFFDIQQDIGSPDVIAVQFARPDGFYGAEGALVETTTAAAAVEALEANPALTILDSSPSRMSGLDGFVIEVENPATASSAALILLVPPGPLSIDPARRLWIALFDTPDRVVAILVGGSAAKWDEALLAAEPVLETVTIGK